MIRSPVGLAASLRRYLKTVEGFRKDSVRVISCAESQGMQPLPILTGKESKAADRELAKQKTQKEMIKGKK